MSQTKTILILGGSYGGVATAHYLLKHVIPSLPQKGNYKIVLVSTSSHFFCRPTSPRALTSEDAFPKDKLFVPLTKAFSQYDSGRIQLITGTAIHLDHMNRTVSVCISADNAEQKIDYHALIIATGATATSPLFGLFGDHTKTQEAWMEVRKKLPDIKTIVIAGGGPTGVETAGELGQYLNGRGGLFGGSSSSNKTAITIVTRSSQILPNLPLPLAQKAEAQLAKLGVSVTKNHKIIGVTPPDAGAIAKDGGDLMHITDGVEITLDNEMSLKADLYIPATGVSPNTAFIDKVLLDDEGYVNVDSTLRVKNGAGLRVYAIGHVSSSQPRAIHAIMSQTPVLCENLKLDLLAGEGESGSGYRELAPETKQSQLVVIGGGGVGVAFGWKIPGFLVWLIKGRDYWLGMTPGMWNGKQFEKAG
jgi:NADH dehydrogenase FAD-containing subunit